MKALFMKLELRRIILFTANMEAMSRFYGEVLGLELVNSERGWKDFNAGACAIALHEGAAKVGHRPPKLAFHAADVAATRAALVRRGAKMGKVLSTAHLDLCDGKDPDGNPFQISSRK
jgi:catechol 2,3-dioxygenase-like lactoylglutathione lyase family enzyme